MDNLGFGIVLSMQDAFTNNANRAIGTMDRLAASAFGLNQITQAVQSMTGALDSFTEPYIALDRSIKNIGSLGRENFMEFKDMVTDMSKSLPDAANLIADGIYDAIGSGIEGSNQELANYIQTTSEAAVAGLTDTSTATKGINAVMNAYKQDVTAAKKISDTFFGAVNYGVVSFEELNRSMATVLPVAAASKVQFDEISGAIAAMTVQGVPAAMAATQLRAAMGELIKPQKVLRDMYDKLGLSINDVKAEIAENGLIKTLQMLQVQATKSGMDMRQVFSSVEAGGAALLLTGENYEKSMGIFHDVQKAAESGATAKAYEVQASSIEVRLKIMRNRVQAWFNGVFDTIGEQGVIALKTFNQFAPTISAMGPAFGMVSVAVSKFRALLMPVALAEGAVATASGFASTGLYAMATAAWAAIAPLLPFIAIGVAVLALFYGMYEAINSSNESWIKFGVILAVLLGPIGWVVGGIMLMKRGFEDFKDVVAGGEIKGGILGFLQKVGGVNTAVMEIWQSATNETFELSGETADALERMGILDFVVNLGTWIARIKNFVVGFVTELGTVWTKLTGVFSELGDLIGPLISAFGGVFDAVMGVFQSMGFLEGGMAKGVGSMGDWLAVGKAVASFLVTGLKVAIDIIAFVLKGVIGIITSVVNAFAWMINSIVGLFKGTTAFSDIGRDIVNGIWNGITGAWEWLTGMFKSIIADLPFGGQILEFFGGGSTEPAGAGQPRAGSPSNVSQNPAQSWTNSAAIGNSMAMSKGEQARPSIVNNQSVTEKVSQINLNVNLDSEPMSKKVIEKQELDKARR